MLIEKLEQNNSSLADIIDKIEKRLEEANVKLDNNNKESPNWKVGGHRYELHSENNDYSGTF